MAAWPQPVEPLGRVAGQVLVAGLPADAKLLAQIGDRETVRLRQRNKANEFFHRAYSGPGHGALCVSHLPGLSVSYLAGSYRPPFILFPGPLTDRVVFLPRSAPESSYA